MATQSDQSTSTHVLDPLDELVRRYQGALLEHLQRKFLLQEQNARDILQSFFQERVITRNIFSRANPERGRFRNFLLRSLDNFALNYLRAEHTLQRCPPGGLVALEDLEGWEPASEQADLTHDFETAWARQVMEQSRERMESECLASDRRDIWDVFCGRILRPLVDGADVTTYEELVSRHNFRDPDQAGNVLITGKRMFQRCLRDVVSEYTQNQEETEDELKALFSILSRCRIKDSI